MWFTVFVLGGVAERGQFPKVLFMGSPQTRELPNWNFSEARGQLPRSELDGSWVDLGSSILTGWMRFVIVLLLLKIEIWLWIMCWFSKNLLLCFRTLLINTLRWFWWMWLMLLLEMIPESIGSPIQCTSTESCVGSPLLGKATGVYVAEDICTTKHVHLAGQPGRETTPCLSAVTANFCCYHLIFASFSGILFWGHRYLVFWLRNSSFERFNHIFFYIIWVLLLLNWKFILDICYLPHGI